MKRLVRVLLFGSLVIGQALAQSQWKTTEKTNAMDNVTVRTASLDSDAAAGEKATLIIRYTGNKAEVYVVTEEVLDDDSVRIKFDDSKPEVQFWGRSTDYHALFASNPQKLIERLKASKTFYIEYRPFQRLRPLPCSPYRKLRRPFQRRTWKRSKRIQRMRRVHLLLRHL